MPELLSTGRIACSPCVCNYLLPLIGLLLGRLAYRAVAAFSVEVVGRVGRAVEIACERSCGLSGVC